MTVKELIDELQKMPQDAQVFCEEGEDERLVRRVAALKLGENFSTEVHIRTY